MKIWIQDFNKEKIQIECLPEDLIREVKQKIYEKKNINPENQVLQYAGRILQDGQTLDSYNVRRESILLLVQQVRNDSSLDSVLIQTVAGGTIKIECGMETTVAEVKEKIFQKIHIEPDAQTLNFGIRERKNNETLAECGVVKGSIMHLTLKLPGGLH